MSQLNFEADPGQPLAPGMGPGPGQGPGPQPVPVTRKQGLNIYTVLLIVSAFCLMAASILFYMELNKFEDWWNTDSQKIVGSVSDTLIQGRQIMATWIGSLRC